MSKIDYIHCPFYGSATKNKLLCEGFNTSDHVCIYFKKPSDIKKFIHTYCGNPNDEFFFKQCALYKQLTKEYSNDDTD